MTSSPARLELHQSRRRISEVYQRALWQYTSTLAAITGIHNVLGDASRNAEGAGGTTVPGETTAPAPTSAWGRSARRGVDGPGPMSDVLHAAALQVSVVPDHAAVSDDGVLRVGAVHDRAVLNGRLGSHDDGAVTPQYGSRHTEDSGPTYIADDDGIRVDESRGVNIRGFVLEA